MCVPHLVSLEILRTYVWTDTRSFRRPRQWPGYQHLRFSRTIFLDPRRGRGVTCKGELAMKVAEAYYEFLMVSARNSLM